jgi:hypothetical protein
MEVPRMIHRFRARLALAVVIASVVLSLGASAVLAGEVTGSGKEVPTQGASWCRFSGLNDRVAGEGPVEPQAQAYGIEVTVGAVPHPSITKGGIPSPGTMCNPNKTILPPLK